jgi:Flp pilus assembly protein TadD
LCLPSILETFPLVPVEAQACGCIPVVHRVGGAPATLNDGVTGFLYEPNNTEQLARTIIKAIETIDKDPAIRDRAANFVRDNLNSANTAQFILPLRDKLAKAAAINSAKALFQDNNIQAAETQSKRLLELYPDMPELLLLKGQLALHNGNVEQCRSALQTIIANNATNQMALNNLGVLAIKQGDNVEALRNLLDAYKLNPYDKNTAINCVIVLKANDMLTEARMVLLMYLTKVGQDAQLLELLQQVNDLIAESSFARQDKSGQEETCNRPLVFPVSNLAADGPLVSVIMTVYNCQDYISQAIESVLIQTYPKFELVIIDDGSTDRTKEVISRYPDQRIRYFYQENGGMSNALNHAVRQAMGEFLLPLDADDMMTPDFIAKHIEEFNAWPDADLVYSDVLLIDDNGNPIRVMTKPAYEDHRDMIRDLFRCGHPIVPFRLGIRRSVYEKIGLYDEALLIGMDYDMMRRFVKAGLKAHHLWETLHLRRMQTESLSRSMNVQKARDHFEVVRRFTETFGYHQLFPDIDWDRIPAQKRELHGKCLIGASYMNLGNEYLNSKQDCMSNVAFEMACGELTDSLRLDPNSENARRLLHQCRQIIAKNQDKADIITPYLAAKDFEV